MSSATTQPADAGDSVDLAPGPDASQPLGGRAARGFAWAAAGRLAVQALQFLSTIVLARLLLPSDYGLIAVVTAFSSFAWLLTDFAFGPALVRATRLTREDAATVFWLNTLLGVVLAAVVVGLSDPIASLYGQPRIAPLLRLASVNFIISMTVVPFAILERRMQFRKVAMIDLAAATLGFTTSIACAAAGLGAVSLVIGPLVTTAVNSSASMVAARWLPHGRPTTAAAKRLLAFGSHLTGFSVINYWARNLDNVLIGKVAGPASLGYYNRAYMLMLLPINQLGSVMIRVLMPVLSRLRGDETRLRTAYLRVCKASSVVTFPLFLGLAGVGSTFVVTAYGERWRGMVTLLVILAISGPPQMLAVPVGPACQVAGKPQLLSTWGNLNTLSVLIAIVAGLPWGAVGVAVALTIRAYLLLPLAILPAKRAIGVSTVDVVRASASAFIAAATMAAAAAALGASLSGVLSAPARLFIQVPTGALIYLAVLALVDRAAVGDLKNVLLRKQLAT